MKEKRYYILSPLLRIVTFFIPLLFVVFISSSQCVVTISNFPYNENFEASNGNWLPGGGLSDWAWGTPSKPVINTAASGSRCWMTGGLSKSVYNDGENSWLQSPCFKFTNLDDPYITFKIFWETETTNDGANLQYSTDNGTNWQVLGAKNEENCLAERWYNVSPLSSLGSQDAWSGSTQASRRGCQVSGGSGSWVTAKHNVPGLANKPHVMFRFVFASSASCNEFDGFALDDFMIGEAPASVASFTYSCSSNLRVNFKNTSTLCPTSFLWDFDDPSSGANNTSTAPEPTHAYTLGGNYSVRLTVSGPGNTSSTYVLPKLEIIENMVASIVTPIRCHDDTTGSLTVNFIGDSSAVHYKWDSDPVQLTRTAVHLGAGDYNITILNEDGCPASANISLGEPPPLLYTLSSVKPNCTASNGSIDISMRGGTPPYSYSWFPDVSNSSSANNLPSGTYKVTVLDNNQCYKIITIDLPDLTDLEASIATAKDATCFGSNDGMATATATGGSTPYAFSWVAPGGNTNVSSNLYAGSYRVAVTDANGCKSFANAIIGQPPEISAGVTQKSTFCGDNNGNAAVDAKGGVGPYKYLWTPGNFTGAAISNLAPGQYKVAIEDSHGCIKIDSVAIAPSSAIQLRLSTTDVRCAGKLTGGATAAASGGTEPYNFQWTNGTEVFNTNAIDGVAAGVYNLNLQDAAGCNVTESVVIKEPAVLKVDILSKPSYCDFSDGSASAVVTGGVLPYSFLWTPFNTSAAALTNVSAGNYELTVTDKNNCSVSILTTISNNRPEDVSLGSDTTLCPGSTIVLSPGVYSKYKWQDNSISPNYAVTNAGIYAVEVTDNLGCILKDTINIIGDCGFIFFPNAFTPNNDMRNDFFGPEGILSTLKDYSLLVYNRLGQLAFKSTDPFKKWDGRMPGKVIVPGTYVWIARYTHKTETNIVQKGAVTVIY